MSELKVYVMPLKTNIFGKTIVGQAYYSKSEADKVIAEKDEKIDELEERIDELQKATDSAWSKVNTMYDELRYQKYKRCLAMKNWCEERSCYLNGLENYQMTDKEYQQAISAYWDRWALRWFKLAKKFNGVK